MLHERSANPREPVAALTTPVGEGGIGVIEVLGSGAVEIVNRIFRHAHGKKLCEVPPGRLLYGHVVDETGEPVDEVLVRVVPEGFPLVEITPHGGAAPQFAVMDLLEKEGAARVDWKRLTALRDKKRGIDTIRTEAHILLCEAKSLQAVRCLTAQMNGALSSLLQEAQTVEEYEKLLAESDFGIALCSIHPTVVFVGKTNAGKSTLVNALLRRDRVLTSDVPGTTRDAVEETALLDGVPVYMVDTAGLTKHPSSAIEEEACRRTVETARAADCVVGVVDGSAPLDEGILEDTVKMSDILVINKTDLGVHEEVKRHTHRMRLPVFHTSALTGDGLKALVEGVLRVLFPAIPRDVTTPIVFTQRQRRILEGNLPPSPEALQELLYGDIQM